LQKKSVSLWCHKHTTNYNKKNSCTTQCNRNGAKLAKWQHKVMQTSWKLKKYDNIVGTEENEKFQCFQSIGLLYKRKGGKAILLKKQFFIKI
jgi:hypothetical protein